MPEELKLTDAPWLSRLHAGCFPRGWSADEFTALLNQPGVIGWRIGDNAFLLARIVADEAEILTFATHETARRQGLGRRLVEKMLDHFRAQGVKRCFLEVAESNMKAIALYEAMKFQKIAKRPGYYKEASVIEDAIIMEITLKLDI